MIKGLIPGLIATGMLMGCLLDDLPYEYFKILRWVVCGVCAYRAYLAYSMRKNIWMWTFVSFAVLFNPVIPIFLDRELWADIDITLSIVILVSFWKLRAPKHIDDNKDSPSAQ